MQQDCDRMPMTTSTIDDRILEHLIQTTSNHVLIQKCNNKGWDRNHFLLEASQMEDTSLQVRDTKPSDGNMNVAKIHYHAGKQASEYRLQQCGYCGRCDHHMAGNNCQAYGRQCRNCLKWNHFAKVCRSQ